MITKNMLIGDAIRDFPHVAEVLMQKGVHCVGCGGAYMETIEQGLQGHGMVDEEINSILTQLNNAVPEELGSKDVIVTKPAVDKMKFFMSEQKVSDAAGLRIQVEAGGCSGFQYNLSFDVPKSDDKVFTIDSVRFMFDKETFNQVKGLKIDYVEGLQGAGFKISNPNAVNTCGCGESFH